MKGGKKRLTIEQDDPPAIVIDQGRVQRPRLWTPPSRQLQV